MKIRYFYNGKLTILYFSVCSVLFILQMLLGRDKEGVRYDQIVALIQLWNLLPMYFNKIKIFVKT